MSNAPSPCAPNASLERPERPPSPLGRRRPLFATPLGRLYQGDCLEVLADLDDASVNLVFADPPFNLGKLYGKSSDDNLPEARTSNGAAAG